MTDVVETSAAEQLEKAVEAAGFVHPLDAPKAVADSQTVTAAANAPAKARLAEIASELTKASPSGVEALAAELAGLVGTL